MKEIDEAIAYHEDLISRRFSIGQTKRLKTALAALRTIHKLTATSLMLYTTDEIKKMFQEFKDSK